MPEGEVFDHPQLSSHRFTGSPAAAAVTTQRVRVLLHSTQFRSSCCTLAHVPVLPKPGSAWELLQRAYL